MSDLQTSESDHDRTEPTMSRPVVLLCVIAALAVGFAVGDRLARSDDGLPKVIDTYCTPIWSFDDDDSTLQTGFGWQVRVREDGSEFTVPVVKRVRDGVVTYEGTCRTSVPAPGTINTRNIWP